MKTKMAALYLRSSKDRSDISPAAQRRMLQELAETKGLRIAAEFSDAVESGKDENRPGFQKLIQAVRNPNRGWSTLLVLDTARIARRRHLAVIFEEMECRKRGVEVVYKSLPDADPITTMLLKSILQAMDEWHSLTSRDKGLAGMAENVKTGFRAGGRAPTGYRLEKLTTGAIRDGEPVTKSKLELDPVWSGPMKRFLEDRATGLPRVATGRKHGLKLSPSTLVHIEWNALTYAGHTVWNVHAERKGGATVGNARRRPRSEWVIQRNTHPALITDAQAETILARLEAATPFRARGRDRGNQYLLTGLLTTPTGSPWHGERGAYRPAERKIDRYLKSDEVEQAVVERVMTDLQAAPFIRKLAEAARAAAADVVSDPADDLRQEAAELAKRITKLVDLAADSEKPAAFLRKVVELESQLELMNAEIAARERQSQRDLLYHEVNESQVRSLLMDLASDMSHADRHGLKQALFTMIDRVEVDPESLNCVVHYRLSANRLMGEATGFDSNSRGDASLNRRLRMKQRCQAGNQGPLGL